MAANTTDRETASLIGSDKVEGTAVYGADEQKIGSIQRVMIDKVSGKVAYAVTSFGGFLGIGEDYYPIPWPTLNTTLVSAATVRASQSINCKARRNIIGPAIGIGTTGHGIAKFTAITIRPYGIDRSGGNHTAVGAVALRTDVITGRRG